MVRGRFTVSALHDVHGLVLAVVRPGRAGHDARRVAHQDDLPPARVQFAVAHAAKLEGRESRAVDDHVRALATVVQRCGVGDVLNDAAAELCAVLAAFADEPGEVERRVDADGREGRGRVDARPELVLGEDTELTGLRALGMGSLSGCQGEILGGGLGFSLGSSRERDLHQGPRPSTMAPASAAPRTSFQ